MDHSIPVQRVAGQELTRWSVHRRGDSSLIQSTFGRRISRQTRPHLSPIRVHSCRPVRRHLPYRNRSYVDKSGKSFSASIKCFQAHGSHHSRHSSWLIVILDECFAPILSFSVKLFWIFNEA